MIYKAIIPISLLIFAGCLYSPESTSTEEKITATWALVESHDFCSKTFFSTPDTAKNPHRIDTFLVITNDFIYWYAKGSCNRTVSAPDSSTICNFADWFCGAYTLAGDSLKGGMWEGSVAYNGGTFWWYTTLSVTSQRLALVRYAWSDSAAGNITIWRKRIFE